MPSFAIDGDSRDRKKELEILDQKSGAYVLM